MQIIDKITLQKFNIEFRKLIGEEHLICPVCSASRKPKNQKIKCFSWNHDINAGFCNHCQATFITPRKKIEEKTYPKPIWKNSTELSENIVKFFENRRISQETLLKLKVSQSIEWMPKAGKEVNTINFNYFENDELINVKYRGANKDFKMFKDGKLIFYNIDSVKNQNECIIVEGEMDCLAVVECGFDSVISVPNGAKNFEFLDNCIDDLNHLEKIIICVDNDEAGLELKKELIRRIGSERCFLVDLGQRKDINDVLMYDGKINAKNVINEAKKLPVSGVQFVSDVFDEMLHTFRYGKNRGTSTHINALDPHYTHRLGEVTIWSGYMNEGKSAFLSQLCILKAKYDGWKYAVFCPENYPISDYYDELIHCYTGKSTDKSYKNCMSETEYEQSAQFIHEHFFAIIPEEDPTIDVILDKMKYLIRKAGVNSCIIDPYNQVEHLMDKGQREDLYISKFMSKLKKFAIDNNVAFHLVAHQLTPQFIKNEDYPCPDGYKIKGGGTFADKADNVVSVWRPFRRSNIKDATVKIVVSKIKKQKLVGIPGIVELFYDVCKNQYRDTLESIEENLPYINKNIEPLDFNSTELEFNKTNDKPF